jgi:putative transposase
MKYGPQYHNRKLNRMKGYDYTTENLYFVTSCVHNRVCCFGEIIDGTGRDVGTGRDLSVRGKKQMILNENGEIAQKQWYWLAEQYPYVVLHAFVVMPNHIHGIIEINRDNIVGTGRDLSLRGEIKIKSLSELMGAYKTTVSKMIHLSGNKQFAWQRSFHDHIIPDDNAYNRILAYIINNPSNWVDDSLFQV